MHPTQGYGPVLGADGKVHQGHFHVYGGGFSAALDPVVEHPPTKDGYPLSAMRPITYEPELALFERMGRLCEACYEA